MDPLSAKRSFLRRIDPQRHVAGLFDHLPDVFFFMKDRRGRFVAANQLFVEKCGVVDERMIVGRRDHDFFPKDRADLYVKDDRRVMESGESIVNRIELAPELDGTTNMFVTTKIPLYDRKGRVIGLAGIARDLNLARTHMKPYARMTGVVDHIAQHFQEELHIPTLAALAGMSVSQFERKFKRFFQVTPQQYLIRIRLNKACRQLIETSDTIAKIALDSGFYDHAHFTRRFIGTFGITPSEYRRRHG